MSFSSAVKVCGWRPVAVVLAVVFLSACGWFAGGGDPVAPPLSMFLDVPVPSDLEVDLKNSQVYDHDLGRVGLMRASGRIAPEAVLNYYREAMIQNGWSRDSEFDNGDRQMLIFSKSPRSASVSVTKGWIDTDVEINVSARKP